MGLISPVVFPLLPFSGEGDSATCACGNPECSRVGKHPAVAWGELTLDDVPNLPPPDDGAGYGIKTGAAPKGSGVFVVDCDDEAAVEWFLAQPGITDARTYTVGTPRGAHFYFTPPAGVAVRNSVGALAPGVDIRGEGGFVVGPGSPHRSGGTYELLDDADPAPTPAWLVEWLRSRPAAPAAQDYPGDVSGDERARRRELFVEHCKTAPPSIAGAGGDLALFRVVQRGAYDLQLPTADVLEVVREHFDPRCEPPWGAELDERVTHKAHSAKTSSTRPRIDIPPPAVAAYFGQGLDMPPPTPDLVAAAARPTRPKRADGPVWGGWDEPVEPPTYLVHGHIPIETVGMFVALGSSLKTWAALDIALAVATGRPWLGKFGVRQGRALIVDYESGDYELRRRAQRVLKAGASPDLGVWASPDVYVDDPALWSRLEAAGPLSLVVIDSLAAGSPASDENEKIAALPLAFAAAFTNRTGASVLFIHHAKKTEGGDDRNIGRGSGAIYAACDWAYKFDNAEETAKYRRMVMVNIKPCMGPRPDPINLELSNENGLRTFDDGTPATAPAENNSDEAIMGAIERALMLKPIATKALIRTAVGKQNKRVGDLVDELEAKGRIACVPDVGYVVNSDEARDKRVRELLSSGVWKTWRAIERATGVPASYLDKLLAEGVIVHSQEGRYVWFGRVNA